MGQFRFSDLTPDGRVEMIRDADVVVGYDSTFQEHLWAWNKSVPRVSFSSGSPAYKVAILEIAVDSPEQLAELKAAVLQVKEGLVAAR